MLIQYTPSRGRYTRGVDNLFGLCQNEYRILRRLTTPQKIQDYLDTLPANFEKRGETHRSPQETLRAGKAHCIEAALVAAAALWLHGEEPLLMDLHSAKGDDDHVVALFKSGGYWGCISKSNHATIRYRDAVYRTPRELAMSYFHEWFPERTGRRTLRSYSAPLNMKKFGHRWVTDTRDLWWLDRELNKTKHYPVAPAKNLKALRRADKVETRAGSITEWSKRDQRT